MRSGFNWLRMGSIGRFLWISLVAEQQSVPHDLLYSMVLVGLFESFWGGGTQVEETVHLVRESSEEIGYSIFCRSLQCLVSNQNEFL
jgi:hypothetical protein